VSGVNRLFLQENRFSGGVQKGKQYDPAFEQVGPLWPIAVNHVRAKAWWVSGYDGRVDDSDGSRHAADVQH
jgi:hypothetical protein